MSVPDSAVRSSPHEARPSRWKSASGGTGRRALRLRRPSDPAFRGAQIHDLQIDAPSRPWFHPDRAAGGDRDHRRLDRPVVAGRASGARGSPPCPVHEQPEAARPGRQQLRVDQWLLPRRIVFGHTLQPTPLGHLSGELQLLRPHAAVLRASTDVQRGEFQPLLVRPGQPDDCRRADQLIDLPERHPEPVDPPPCDAGIHQRHSRMEFQRDLSVAARQLDPGLHQLRRQCGHLDFRLLQPDAAHPAPVLHRRDLQRQLRQDRGHHRRHQQHLPVRRAQQGAPVHHRPGLCHLG